MNPPVSVEAIQNRFGFHPANDKTKELHQTIREAFIDLATEITRIVPDGREQALCLTHLQEAAMWANAGVACNLAPLKLGE